jgi:hypothetical protein
MEETDWQLEKNDRTQSDDEENIDLEAMRKRLEKLL